jgi:mono/diheme cytochrome c family protein
MNSKSLSFFFLLVFIMVSVPVLIKAQESREGNHCAIAKSPYRLAMDSGKSVYTVYCASCHQPGGTGIVNQSPSLYKKEVTSDKKKLIEILIGNHVSFDETESKTSNYERPENPALSDLEIAYVLTYIRNSFGNKASAVKVSEVKSLRGH